MHIRLLAFSTLLAACSSSGAKVVLPDDMTASDTASSDDTATDTGSSTDTGGTTDTATNSVAGTYTGDVEGTLTSLEGGGGGGGGMPPELPCSGSVSVDVSEDGSFSGQADCTDRNGMSFEGPLDGNVRNGRANATWSIRMGRSNVDFALDGTLANGGLELSGVASDDRFELSVALSATR